MPTADYLIIGGGTAACIIANRLSKNPSNEVLLLEAGGKPDNPKLHIPVSFSQMFKSRYDWNYETVPQRHVNNRKMYQPRGKMLGGCSQINAMIYIRGAAADYDYWASLGLKNWSYENVLPYFIKGKNNCNIEGDYHQKGGEQFISKPRYKNPLIEDFKKAGVQLGFRQNPDFNGSTQLGIGEYQVFQQEGRRHSCYEAYLKPAIKRSNLNVITGANVDKINIKDGKAVSVNYIKNGKTITAFANKEIILCAGAFGSPMILQRSGIGDTDLLSSLNIKTLVDSPGVGKNLQDHLAYGINLETKKELSLDGLDDMPRVFTPLLQYLLTRQGPFTSNVAQGGAFFKSKPSLEEADLQILFAPATFIKHGFIKPKKYYGFTVGACHIQPKSKGFINITDHHVSSLPHIDPNYLSEEADQEAVVAGFRMIQRFCETVSLKQHIHKWQYPSKALQTDNEIMDFLRQYIQTLYHPVGTCRMGIDKDAVVDQRLKVKGLEGLRVADASVMPNIIRGNTQAPVMMIAERAAEFIKEERLTLSTKMIY